MKVKEIAEILEGEVLCCEHRTDTEVKTACGSDMMSDVLAFVKEQAVLVTGLVNPQVIRTAEMMDMHCIVFVRGKKPSEEMIEMAQERNMVIICSEYEMFTACGKLYEGGLRGGSGK